MTGDERSLRDQIRAISIDTGEIEPHAVAEKLIGQLSADERQAALRLTLPDYVRRVLGTVWPVPANHWTTDAQAEFAGGQPDIPADQTMSDAQKIGVGGDQSGSDPGQMPPDAQGTPAGVAARRRKGVRANWSTDAKTRAYLIAASCIKQARSPYRAVYDTRRAHTSITHPEWSPGHSHNDALRVASKAILRDLWAAARDSHEAEADA